MCDAPLVCRAAMLLLPSLLVACAEPQPVQEPVDLSMAEQIPFVELRRSPPTYEGRVVILGGEVLSAIEIDGAVRFEVLQLPLDDSMAPVLDKSASQGRLLAYREDLSHDGQVPAGTLITIVGKVTGSIVLALDEEEYLYPVLEIGRFAVWPDPFGRPYPGVFGTYCSPFRGFAPYGGVHPFAGRIYPLWC